MTEKSQNETLCRCECVQCINSSDKSIIIEVLSKAINEEDKKIYLTLEAREKYDLTTTPKEMEHFDSYRILLEGTRTRVKKTPECK